MGFRIGGCLDFNPWIFDHSGTKQKSNESEKSGRRETEAVFLGFHLVHLPLEFPFTGENDRASTTASKRTPSNTNHQAGHRICPEKAVSGVADSCRRLTRFLEDHGKSFVIFTQNSIMESALEAMCLPSNNDADLTRMNGLLVKQGEMLQEVGRNFSQTVESDGGESGVAVVSPLLVHAMDHTKRASLGSLHLLAAQAEVLTPRDRTPFIDVTLAFLEHCEWRHVVIAPKYVGDVCQKFAQVCILEGRAVEAILPLRTAAYRMGSATSSLTPVHPEFLQCCIMAKCYSLGARFMDEQPIFGVEPKATALTPVHFLRYFYYGGLVYIGTKRWRDALDSFVMLLAAPANVLSSLVVEGYKKMVLVALIMSGNLPTLPKYAPNVVTRHLKSHAAAYEALGRCCQARDTKGLNAAVLAGVETFKQDGNMGLAKQVVSALTKRKIMQLTHTYVTLSLKDISNKVGLEHPEDTEGYILQMIEAGEISAKITCPTGTVHFQEDAQISSSVTMTPRLEADLQSTAELTERVRKLEAKLMTNPIFVQKMLGDHSVQGAALGGSVGYSTWDDIGMGD